MITFNASNLYCSTRLKPTIYQRPASSSLSFNGWKEDFNKALKSNNINQVNCGKDNDTTMRVDVHIKGDNKTMYTLTQKLGPEETYTITKTDISQKDNRPTETLPSSEGEFYRTFAIVLQQMTGYEF
jgi:hypothetical protein